jgi:hypothetical protein
MRRNTLLAILKKKQPDVLRALRETSLQLSFCVLDMMLAFQLLKFVSNITRISGRKLHQI